MRTWFIFKGLPGCGKSTEAAQLIKREPGRWIRINRDDLRGMCVGHGNNPHQRDNDREELVRHFKDELIRSATRQGYDVILDDTHLVPMTVKKLHTLAMTVGDVKVIEKGINVSVEECIKRDSTRTGFSHVGDKVIKDMARGAGIDKGRKLSDKETYYAPRWAPGGDGNVPASTMYDPTSTLPKAIICDLDGTAALMNGRSPYDATHCHKDLPNVPVVETVLAMHAQGVKVLFTSGRDSKYMAPTRQFLDEHFKSSVIVGNAGIDLHVEKQVIPYELFMRGEGDMRKDSIIKTELFDQHIKGKYNVIFALDDRNQVVDNWREMGIATFQVAPGAF